MYTLESCWICGYQEKKCTFHFPCVCYFLPWSQITFVFPSAEASVGFMWPPLCIGGIFNAPVHTLLTTWNERVCLHVAGHVPCQSNSDSRIGRSWKCICRINTNPISGASSPTKGQRQKRWRNGTPGFTCATWPLLQGIHLLKNRRSPLHLARVLLIRCPSENKKRVKDQRHPVRSNLK